MATLFEQGSITRLSPIVPLLPFTSFGNLEFLITADIPHIIELIESHWLTVVQSQKALKI